MDSSSPPPLRAFLSTPFLISALVLLAAAAGIRPAIAALDAYYSKDPIAIRRPLKQFDDSQLVSFRRVTAREKMGLYLVPADFGTDEWIAPVYTPIWLAHRGERKLNVMLNVTWFSNPRDTIPHTPEVCYRQGGATVHSVRTISLEVPGLPEKQRRIKARLLEIELRRLHSLVLYVFCCDGKFYHDRERVRWAMGWPGNKYTYFSKVEAVTAKTAGAGEQDPMYRCKRLLSEALPALISEHYPPPEALKRR